MEEPTDKHAMAVWQEPTAKQFELIGRLTIQFNNFEDSLDSFVPMLLGLHELSLGTSILGSLGTFSAKAEFFSRALAQIELEYPDLKHLVTALSVILGKAKGLSKDRNKFVHSTVRPVLINETPPVFTHKKGFEQGDESTLAGLLSEISETHSQFAWALVSLLMEISIARETRRSESLIAFKQSPPSVF
jgi:hypothetical protein